MLLILRRTLEAKRNEAEANPPHSFIIIRTTNQLKNSLTMPAEEVEQLLKSTNHWTIRFKIPEGQTVIMEDPNPRTHGS